VLSRLVRSLLLALTLAVAGAATAHAADSLTLTAGADATEEVPVAITATWNLTSESRLFITAKPGGSLGCAANYQADDANSDDVAYNRNATLGAGTTTANYTLNEPGSLVLCAYLQDSSSDGTPRAVQRLDVPVRSARATLALNAPARVGAGQKFAVSVPVTAELERFVFVTIKPAGGRGCESAYSLEDPNSDDVLYNRGAQGTQTLSGDWTASSIAGSYLLCGYVQEGTGDLTPEATASATVAVGPDPCAAATTALTKAQKAVKTAESAVSRNRTLWKRYDKRARRAHGAARRSLARKARTYKSRYRSAVRSRSKARAKLATAQAGKVAACGS